MSLKRIGVLAALLASAVHGQSHTQFPDRSFDIRRFGADTSESKWNYDTVPIQQAIDACAAAGGGTVIVPKGNWLVGPLFLKSNVRLEIQRGAELAATTEERLYRKTPETERYANHDYIAIINLADAHNVAIEGEGRIDGQGAVWWEKWRATTRATGVRPGANRPRLLYAHHCENVSISGVSFYNSPSFHLVFKSCDGVTIDHVHITALAHSPNTDAIDPIDTRNMLIENNVIDCGDDVVAIKAAEVDPRHPEASCENIVIRGNTVLKGRGISIGSETSGGVRHVLIENNTIHDSMYGIRIKTPRPRGGEVSDVIFRNTRLVGVETPIVISGYYESLPKKAELERLLAAGSIVLNDQYYPPENTAPIPVEPHRTPVIHDVTIDGLSATGADLAGVIIGRPEAPIRSLVLRDVKIESTKGLLVRNAEVKATDSSIKTTEGPAVTRQRAAEVSGL